MKQKMEWDWSVAGWTWKYIKSHIGPQRDREPEDWMQDAFIIFMLYQEEFAHLEPRQFMAYYMRGVRWFVAKELHRVGLYKKVLRKAAKEEGVDVLRHDDSLSRPPRLVAKLLEALDVVPGKEVSRRFPNAAKRDRESLNKYLCNRAKIKCVGSVDVVLLLEKWLGARVFPAVLLRRSGPEQ